MEHERLMAWFAETDLVKVLDHVGHHGGEVNFDAVRLACRRASERIKELESDIASFERVSRRLMKTWSP